MTQFLSPDFAEWMLLIDEMGRGEQRLHVGQEAVVSGFFHSEVLDAGAIGRFLAALDREARRVPRLLPFTSFATNGSHDIDRPPTPISGTQVQIVSSANGSVDLGLAFVNELEVLAKSTPIAVVSGLMLLWQLGRIPKHAHSWWTGRVSRHDEVAPGGARSDARFPTEVIDLVRDAVGANYDAITVTHHTPTDRFEIEIKKRLRD